MAEASWHKASTRDEVFALQAIYGGENEFVLDDYATAILNSDCDDIEEDISFSINLKIETEKFQSEVILCILLPSEYD